jgi:hypothetical protein
MPRQKAHDLTKKKKEEKKGKKGTKKPTFTKTFKKSGKEAMTGLQIKNLAFKVASKFLESASVEELNQAALDLIESRALNDGRFYALTSDVKPPAPNVSQDQRPAAKPKGQWFAYEDEWLEFLATDYETGIAGKKYLFSIKPSSSCLFIKNKNELKKFEKKYGEQDPYSGAFVRINIKWNEVAKDYSGIVISPYRQEARLESDWYYGWDVASGCVWSPAGIASIKLEYVYSEESKSFEKVSDSKEILREEADASPGDSGESFEEEEKKEKFSPFKNLKAPVSDDFSELLEGASVKGSDGKTVVKDDGMPYSVETGEPSNANNKPALLTGKYRNAKGKTLLRTHNGVNILLNSFNGQIKPRGLASVSVRNGEFQGKGAEGELGIKGYEGAKKEDGSDNTVKETTEPGSGHTLVQKRILSKIVKYLDSPDEDKLIFYISAILGSGIDPSTVPSKLRLEINKAMKGREKNKSPSGGISWIEAERGTNSGYSTAKSFSKAEAAFGSSPLSIPESTKFVQMYEDWK